MLPGVESLDESDEGGDLFFGEFFAESADAAAPIADRRRQAFVARALFLSPLRIGQISRAVNFTY